jgi:hypothetical protein
MKLLFWSPNTGSDGKDSIRKITYLALTAFARITLFTRLVKESTIRVNFDFNLLRNLLIKLIYQAIVLNNLEVFKIIKAGNVEALKKALAIKTASLTD